MSYVISRWRLAALGASLSLGAVACGGDDTDQGSVDTAVDTVVTASPSRLLDVDDFVDSVDSEPSPVLVNVHIPYEGHIGGTDAFVPFDEIGEWDDLPADLDAPIALYCRSGNMSAQATDTLVDLGYTNIVDLEGGMNAWTAAGNQLQTSR
ncbi:MAG: rhodanese-like domain-containing protein [Ilumatobacteraceae bacterium]|nr:rhodanese-like domain-containing protein [Ilumatobacteraceae bacterium]